MTTNTTLENGKGENSFGAYYVAVSYIDTHVCMYVQIYNWPGPMMIIAAI